MIPVGWDDGFSVNISGCITVRPMLQEQRRQWKQYMEWMGHAAGNRTLLRAPTFFGPKPEIMMTEKYRDQLKQCLTIIAGYSEKQEQEDIDEIISGLILLVEKPNFAAISCNDCRKWVVNAKGEIMTDSAGNPSPRPPLPVLCEMGPPHQCPKGHHSHEKTVTDRVIKIWNHFWQWQTNTPVCPIIARNHAIVRWVLSGRNTRSYPILSRSNLRRAFRGPIGSPVAGRGIPLPASGGTESPDAPDSGISDSAGEPEGTCDTGGADAETSRLEGVGTTS